VVTRLSAASGARQGESLQVWLDTAKVHVFDPSNGRNLTLSEQPAAAAPA
jgi:multiple sugar transport system ATP-binding protein